MEGDPDYLLRAPAEIAADHLRALAASAHRNVFRTTFDQPGAALIQFDQPVSSIKLRQLMVQLKKHLSQFQVAAGSPPLVYLSAVRFNSGNTTRIHLDGAPEQSFLMIGYESSTVPSRVAIADYSRAAYDWGITPRQLLDHHNPMYGENERRLAPYLRPLEAFVPARDQILLLNNSSQPWTPAATNQLGVMHQATVLADATPGRILNSTMLVPATALPGISTEDLTTFLKTTEIAGYP